MGAEPELELLNRVLDQNERLIELLTRAVCDPVALVKALTPAPEAFSAAVSVPEQKDPFEGDEGHPEALDDPWGDEKVTTDRLLAGRVHGGWVEPHPLDAEANESTQDALTEGLA